jgi:chromosomal replication initiation ATPase DnaA
LLAKTSGADPLSREARELASLDPDEICAAVARHYGVKPSSFARRHDRNLAREAAAWLCRRHTEASLHALAPRFGLSTGGSVPNLVRRLEAKLKHSPRLAKELDQIMRTLDATSLPPSAAPAPPSPRKPVKRGQAGGRKTRKRV